MRLAAKRGFLVILIIPLFLVGCISLEPFGRTLLKARIPDDFTASGAGWGSHYGTQFSGRATSSGEPYQEGYYTAAHPTLPMGTIVLVRRAATGRYVFVRINDRGPFVAGRVIDLSHAAAAKVGLLAAGIGRVELFVIPPQHPLIAHL
ncbi:septal ring lytic transglycosylase RlpA family protein [bacterium]|nr:septal ring lytic transglycosylase RlpA family protein [bacterium]